MKNKKLWRGLLILGIIPFAVPFLGFGYEMLNGSSWELFDYWILYSFLFWPTYIPGLALIVLAAYKLIKKK